MDGDKSLFSKIGKFESFCLESEKFNILIGVDEVGRGCLAGPAYVCALVLDYQKFSSLKKSEKKLIRDSKTLSKKERAQAYELVNTVLYKCHVTPIEIYEIEERGILKAILHGMKKAVEEVLKNFEDTSKALVLVDGREKIPDLTWPQKTIIKGDNLCFAIAAASILAKETRDKYMRTLDGQHPGYGFYDHVGYGTSKHLQALQKLGPSLIHRKNFEPIKSMLLQKNLMP